MTRNDYFLDDDVKVGRSVVGGRDGLQYVLHDEGEGREAADHEEVGDGALPGGSGQSDSGCRCKKVSHKFTGPRIWS